MISNFAFLQKGKNFTSFAPLMLQAERAMSISPMLAATQARAALEVTVKWLYGAIGIRQPVIYGEGGKVYSPKLSDLLKDKEFRAEVTDINIYEMMWAITKIGNKAVHTGAATKAEGMLALKQLLQVGNWVDYLYGEDDDYAETRAFDESLVLIVQATGTGKTRVSAGISDIMLRSDWAYRILFLADRNPLVRQGKNRYTEIFGNTYPLCNLVLRSPSAPLFMP